MVRDPHILCVLRRVSSHCCSYRFDFLVPDSQLFLYSLHRTAFFAPQSLLLCPSVFTGLLRRVTKLGDGTTVDLRDYLADTSGLELGGVVGSDSGVGRPTGWELASHWDSDDDSAPVPRPHRSSGFSAPEVFGMEEGEEEGEVQEGEEEDVVFDDRLAYASALEVAWLSQQQQQIAALRTGMSQVSFLCASAYSYVCV